MVKKIKNKKGQITLFVILGVVIVGGIILFFTVFQGNIQNVIRSQQLSTTQILEQCVNTQVEEAVDIIIGNVGTVADASLTKTYQYEEVPYLCYTALPNTRCIPQPPVLISFLRNEILDYITPKINDCFTNLKDNLEDQAYQITLGNEQEVELELLPGRIRTRITRDFSQTKADDTRTFEIFEANLQTPLYFMNKITNEIVYQESTICNSDYIDIMRVNPSVEISRFQTGDDVKIYTIKDKDTDKGWKFAIRTCVLPIPS